MTLQSGKLWPGKNPIGGNLRLGTGGQSHGKGELVPDGPVYQVIGVVNDTRGASFDGSDSSLIYLRLPEDHIQDHAIIVRTQAEAKQIMPSLRPLISSIDPEMEVDSYTLEELLRLSASFFLRQFCGDHRITSRPYRALVGFHGHLWNCQLYRGDAYPGDWRPHGSWRPKACTSS